MAGFKDRMAIESAGIDENQRSQIVTFNPLTFKDINRKYLPYAFSEQGIAMLSSILKSERAIDVNISIMRAFVLLRHHASQYADFAKKVDDLERQMNRKFKDVHEALKYLMRGNQSTEIGFKQASQNP